MEEHYEAGGAYEAVCGVGVTKIKRIKQMCVTKIPGSAKPTEQLEIQNIDANSIVKEAKSFM